MSKNVKLSLAARRRGGRRGVRLRRALRGRRARRTETTSERDELLVRPQPAPVTDGPDATFVEFLDFECESCGALYPTIEELKDTYGDRVTFVVRHMPLHTSSVNAARAAEAAAEQGEFEAMYDLLFQRQADWGHQSSPEEDLFFDYAEELGLDMDQLPRATTTTQPPSTHRAERGRRPRPGRHRHTHDVHGRRTARTHEPRRPRRCFDAAVAR